MKVTEDTIGGVKQNAVLLALRVQYPEVEVSDWRGRAVEYFAEQSGQGADFEEYIRSIRYLPDGFVISPAPAEVLFFEVEVHNPMSGDKLRCYAKMAIDLAFYQIAFAVLAVNKHGHINPVDLLPHYADWIRSLQP